MRYYDAIMTWTNGFDFFCDNQTFFKISHLAIDSTEHLFHDQNYDQQAKDTLFRNRL